MTSTLGLSASAPDCSPSARAHRLEHQEGRLSDVGERPQLCDEVGTQRSTPAASSPPSGRVETTCDTPSNVAAEEVPFLHAAPASRPCEVPALAFTKRRFRESRWSM